VKRSFWKLARGMLRYRYAAAGALLMSFVAAGGVGVGLFALLPITKNFMGKGEGIYTLPYLAQRFNEQVADIAPGLMISQERIASLPTPASFGTIAILLGVGILAIVGGFASFLHTYLSLTVTTRTIADIRRAAYRSLLRMPLPAMISGGGHDMTSRILGDTNSLNKGFQALTSKAVAQITRGFAALVVALIIDWRLSLLLLIGVPLLYTVIRRLGKRIRRASRGAMKSGAKLLEDAGEVTRGFRTVKVFSAERSELGRFSRHNRDVQRETLRARTAQAVAGPLVETLMIFMMGIMMGLAAAAIRRGWMEIEDFLIAASALGIAGASIKPLTAIAQDIQGAEAGAGRLMEVLNARGEEERHPRRPRLPRHTRSIEFREVSFSYPGQDSPALDRVSVRIEHGQRVAIVGPNGCGKTTLLSLVPRLLLPGRGQILIDGVDISQVSLRSLRRQIGAVPQETILFRGTIATNIAYASARATRAQIEAAAKAAHADRFIREQPDGYETVVGDQGLTLSGGQRQRIAIARALLRDPAILIMDEATSMIDSESEAQIAAAIAELGGKRTCLIVAHRLTTVLNADRIVVMNAGRVVDEGRHDELLDRCALYRDLTRHQLAPATAGAI